MSHFSKLLLKFGLLILLVNALGMWVFFYFDHQSLRKLQQLDNLPIKVQPQTEKTNLDTRVTDLETTQNGLTGRVEELEKSVTSVKPFPTRATVQSSSSKTQKEYTIYLGEGSTVSRDWTTVQSTTISLDSKKYPGMSAVYFESALSIIGGEAKAQLIDAESGGLISSSALINNTQTATWKSQKVTLETGTHIYVVQLKSSSGELATLSGARLRIIAD
ncbi:MAG: hypothetical protein ABI425_05580 [Patescibacteria group bacterium]